MNIRMQVRPKNFDIYAMTNDYQFGCATVSGEDVKYDDMGLLLPTWFNITCQVKCGMELFIHPKL